ncbi:MAG: ROK family protein, partial [Candidatus Dormibacteria bacterium]
KGCRSAVEVTSRCVCIGLIGLVNNLNPEMLILGGMFEDLFRLDESTIRDGLQRGIYDAEHQRVEVVTPRFGRDAVLIGAAELALQAVLNDPASVPPSMAQGSGRIVQFPTRVRVAGGLGGFPPITLR